MAPIFVRKVFTFTQVQLSAPISPSEWATNFALASLRTAAVAELAYQKYQNHYSTSPFLCAQFITSSVAMPHNLQKCYVCVPL